MLEAAFSSSSISADYLRSSLTFVWEFIHCLDSYVLIFLPHKPKFSDEWLMNFIQAGTWVKTSCSWITCSWVADMQLSVEKKKKFGVASQLKVQDVTPLLSKPQTSGASSSQDSTPSVIHVSHTVSWFQPELMAAVIHKGHVAWMGEIKIVYEVLVIEPESTYRIVIQTHPS